MRRGTLVQLVLLTLLFAGIATVVERLVAVDASDRRGVSFIYAAHPTGGELEPQLGEIAEAGWVERAEIAASGSRLHRLLLAIEATASPAGVAYVTGLGTRRA